MEKSKNRRRRKKKSLPKSVPDVVYTCTADQDWMNEDRINYPEYESLKSRMKTFATYPVKSKARRELFAKTGFFYAGIADWVVCFRCALGLKNWDDKEDPAQIHALIFPFCLNGKAIPEDELVLYDLIPTSAEAITAEEMEEIKEKMKDLPVNTSAT